MPRRLCMDPGCPHDAEYRGRCRTHSRLRERTINRKGTSIYGTKRWAILRRSVLFDEPFCRHCKDEGTTTLATDVDHIVPIDQGGPEWDPTNLQPLCRTHHSQKTRREQQGLPEQDLQKLEGVGEGGA